MEFTFAVTLERLALTKIVSSLWNAEIIRKQIILYVRDHFNCLPMPLGWNQIITNVFENVEELDISTVLEKKIKSVAVASSEEILSWLKQHVLHSFGHSPLKLPLVFVWTPQGTIDKRKTVEYLTRNETIYINFRYYWACIYCLEQEIPILWKKIDWQGEIHFPYEHAHDWPNGNYSVVRLLLSSPVVAHWTTCMDREMTWLHPQFPLRSEFETKFRQCASSLYVLRNLCGQIREMNELSDFTDLEDRFKRFPESAQYFWRSLTPEERHNFSSTYIVPPLNFTDSNLQYFIFSQLDEENRMRVLRESTKNVLLCFLKWPQSEFFIDLVNHTWDFLTTAHLQHLAYTLLRKSYNCFVSSDLFAEFFRQCPDNRKKYFLCENTWIVCNCPFIFEKDTGLSILNHAIWDKREGIFDYQGLEICKALIVLGHTDVLKKLISEHLSTSELLKEFKKSLKMRILWNNNDWDVAAELQNMKTVFDSLFRERNKEGHKKKKRMSEAK